MTSFLKAVLALGIMIGGVTPAAAKPADSWDGLMRVKSKRLEVVYLLPDADFRGYTKIMLDPTVVAFKKNWQRDINSSRVGTSGRVSDADARQILDEAQTRFGRIVAESYEKAGYQVVTTAGPDVLRLSTGIINLEIQAPDTMSAGRTRTYSREAGEATLVLEVRDSISGAILGRAVDPRSLGDSGPYLRNSVTNTAEFEQLFARWAKWSVEGLAALKANSPIDAAGKPQKP